MENKNDQILEDFDLEKEEIINHTWHSNIGKWVAIVSFIVGTILFISGVLFRKVDYIFIAGLYFVIGAFFLNLLVFFVLLITSTTPQEKSINRRMALMMLINIPITMLYFLILIGFFSS